MKFSSNTFFYSLALLIIALIVALYVRFLSMHDYMVGYEGECDPAISDCYIGCEDDECTEEYYYSEVVKYAPDIYRECGEDITDCKEASICLPSDYNCSVTYCDLEVDGDMCEALTSDPEESIDEEGGMSETDESDGIDEEISEDEAEETDEAKEVDMQNNEEKLIQEELLENN